MSTTEEKMAAGDAAIDDAIAAGDAAEVGTLLDRWKSARGRAAAEAFLTEELTTCTVEGFVDLHPAPQRQSLRRLMSRLIDEWLEMPEERARAIAIIERLRARYPGDAIAFGHAVRADLATIEELRAALLRDTGLADPLVYALVRRGDLDWLAERARVGALSSRALAALPRAIVQYDGDRRGLTELAFEVPDSALLASVLEHVEPGPAVVLDSLRRSDAPVHAAAMRHAHRLPDPLAVLRGGLRHDAASVRRAALRALLERPDPAALPDVRPLLDDPDPWDERYNPEPVGDLARRFVERFGG